MDAAKQFEMLASLSISVTVDLYCVLSQASYLLRQLDMACVYEGSHSFDLHFTGVCDTANGSVCPRN